MKISIITATYNSAATVRSTIESILGQTYSDWEHIVADGGSNDGTLEIFENYRNDYNGRLKIVSEPDHGIYDAMNKGIERSTGSIVGLLNSDDYYTRPTVLERIADAFASDEVEGVYGDIMYVDPDDQEKVLRYYSSAPFRRWKMVMGFMPAHPSFYCRHEVYDRHGAFDTDFRVAADFENLLRVIYVGKTRVKYLPMNFVTMRLGGASTSGFESYKVILKEHLRAYRKNGVHSGLLLDYLRYPYKIAELISFRLHTRRNL